MGFKKCFSLVFLIVGTLTGAGFVSGREIGSYFSKFGVISIFFCSVCVYFFYKYISLCLTTGKKFSENTKLSVILKTIFGKWYSFINLLLMVSVTITTGGMIAGSVSSMEMLGLFSSWIMYFVFIALAYLVLIKDLKGIKILNNILIPIIIFVIVYVALGTIISSDTFTILFDDVFYQLVGGTFHTIIYICSNMLLIGVFLLQIGSKYSHKEIKISATISSIIIVVLMLLITTSIILSPQEVINSDIPMLLQAFYLGKEWSIIFVIILLLGIFTTLLSSVYIVAKYLNSYIESYKLCLVLSLLSGFIISLIGFYNIVYYLYGLSGFFGILFTIFFLRFVVCEENNIRKDVKIFKKVL